MTNDLQEKEQAAETKPAAKNSKLRAIPNAFKKTNKKTKRLIVVVAIIAILIAVLLIKCSSAKQAVPTAANYTNAAVERRNISKTLKGSGTLEPADSYTVTTLAEGEILSSDIKEGDKVKKDDVLFNIDSSDMQTTLERAKISFANAQRSYQTKLENMDNLKVSPYHAGVVTEIKVKVGDDVKMGQAVATVKDTAVLKVVLPFPSDDAAGFYVGESAVVTIDGTFEQLSGTVAKINGADQILAGNIMVRYVTIEVNNPGALSEALYATASVGGASCAESAKFEYNNNETVTAAVAGTVERIDANEGAWVERKQAIVTLSSKTVTNDLISAQNSLRDAELALENSNKKNDDYTIKSPIDGTIVQKNYKQGDTIQTGAKLCIVYDLSYLTITVTVDELDITDVKVGQKATITADAVTGKTFSGVVTKVSSVGTTANGVTTYPITVQLDEFEGLMPGMNVSANIIVANVENALAVPVSAVQRGNRVLVKQGEGGGEAAAAGIPAGFAYVNVNVGISDGSFIEIKDGLKEGDEITYSSSSAQTMYTMSAAQQPVQGGGPGSGGPVAGGQQGGSGMGAR